MLTKTTTKHVLRSQAEIDKALETNRLKPWERMPLIEIKARIDKFVENHLSE